MFSKRRAPGYEHVNIHISPRIPCPGMLLSFIFCSTVRNGKRLVYLVRREPRGTQYLSKSIQGNSRVYRVSIDIQ